MKSNGNALKLRARKVKPAWLLPVVVGAALRLALLFCHGGIETDGVQYATNAKLLMAGKPPATVPYRPLYPLLTGLASKAVGDVELAGRLVSWAAGTASVYLAYALTAELYVAPAPAYAAWLLALAPVVTWVSGEVMTTSLFLALMLWCVLALSVSLRLPSVKSHLRLAALLVAGALTRPEGFGLLLYSFLVALGAVRVTRLRFRQLLSGAACTALVVLVVFLPYRAFVDRGSGTAASSVASRTGLTSLVRIPVGTKRFEPQVERETYGLHKTASPEHSLRPAQPAFWKKWTRAYASALEYAYTQSLPINVPPWVLMLAGVGAFCGQPRFSRRRANVLLGLLTLLLLFSYAQTSVVPRYFVTFIPLFLVWAGAGIAALGRSGDGDPARIRPPHLAVLVVTILTLLPATLKSVVTYPKAPEFRVAGEWLKAHSAPNDKVMCRMSQIAFYADREKVPLPYASLGEILAYAQKQRVAFFVVEHKVVGESRPQMKALLTHKDAVPELEWLHRVAVNPGNLIDIYRLKRTSG